MFRRSIATVALVVAPLFGATGPTSAQTPPSSTSSTSTPLPGTTLEAQQRDDGNTSLAPWLIGSGLAAAVSVGMGGLWLRRQQD